MTDSPTVTPEAAFAAWMKRTGWSQTRLAEECDSSRAHLNQVLAGKRTGGHTWRRIVRVLPMEGLLLLQQCSAWNKYAAAALLRRQTTEVEAAKLQRIAARCRGEPQVDQRALLAEALQ